MALTTSSAKEYVTQQDDTWDMISLRVYGMKKGADHYMHKLLEANPALHDYNQLPGGLLVTVPEIQIQTTIVLVPWKSAAIVSP